MAHTKSAVKRAHQNVRRRLTNVSTKSMLKTRKRGMLGFVAAGNADQARVAFSSYVSALDKAVKRGIISRNTADRGKSRAALRMKALAAK